MPVGRIGWFIVQVVHVESGSETTIDFLVMADKDQPIAEAALELERTILLRFRPMGPRKTSATFSISGTSPLPKSLHITISQLLMFLRELPVPSEEAIATKPDLFGFGTNEIRVRIYDTDV
ncbi:hypothetical protein K440DRAFT_244212 [Wilcoxina mikolae CBS 423.85]|nr:hypothetical protein K440DRAFT_244212 [Wilcoxina mikolae CBS 423.85]